MGYLVNFPLKKPAVIVLLIAFLCNYSGIAFANPGSMAADYLFERGQQLYQVGRYQEALHEFKKILLIEPEHEGAIRYVQLISGTEPVLPEPEKLTAMERALIMQESLESMEIAPGRGQTQTQLSLMPSAQPAPRLPASPVKTLPSLPSKLPVQPVQPSIVTAQTEELPAMSLTSPQARSLKTPGAISLFINGKEAYVSKPILIKDGEPLISLRGVAANLYFTVIDLKGGKFKLISPQGTTQEVTATLVEQEPMLTQKQLKDYFSVDTGYDPAGKTFSITTRSYPKFQTYVLEKPAAQVKQEQEMQELSKKIAALPEEKPSYIPTAALPSVDLRGNATYTYIKYHLTAPFRSISSSLSGRFYDFNLAYAGLWKDINRSVRYDYAYLNLTKPDLYLGLFQQYIDLSPLRLQTQNFTGLKVSKLWDNPLTRTTFAGGNTETSVSGSTGTVQYEGQVYGLKQAFSLFERLELQSAVLYLQNRAKQSEFAGKTSMPRDNLVGFSAASLKLPYDFTVSAQFAHCLYDPDNDPNASVQDWDYRLATDLHKQRYNLGVAYEFVGDRYASVGNPANYQDFKGWNLYGNYRVTDYWMLNSYASYYHDNVANDDNKPRTHNTILNLSSYHQITKEQSANLSLTHFVSNPAGVNAGPSGETDLYRIDYFLPFFSNMRMGLNYMFSTNSSGGAASNHAHTSGGTLFRGFGRGSSWFISQQFTDTIYKGADDTFNATTSFNLNYVFAPWLTLYFNSSYNRDRAGDSPTRNTFAGSSGFKYQVLPDTNFSMEYNINGYDPKSEHRKWPKSWSLLFYLSQNFRVSTPPNFGTIDGYVCKDIKGSSGIEGAYLYLEDKHEAVSDSQGYYKFSYVTPGLHKVTLDLSNVPAEWTSAELEKTATVKPRKVSRTDFLLIKSVTITGKVFNDTNGDMVYQENEEPLENIAVTLEPGSHFTRTDSDGNFKFAYLLPGKYTAKIRTEDIPLGYELKSKPEITTDLRQGKTTGKINFAVGLLSSAKKKE